MEELDCEDCHMPGASKSAVAFNPLKGDVKTHIFAINTDPVTAEEGMFFEDTDGALVSRGAVTLDFVCLQCHNGTDANAMTVQSASTMAPFVHPNAN